MKCPICQNILDDDSLFCGICGSKIPRCPSCGKVIYKRTRFCTYDGTELPGDVLALLPESKGPAASRADVNLSFSMPEDFNYTEDTPKPGSNPEKYWTWQESPEKKDSSKPDDYGRTLLYTEPDFMEKQAAQARAKAEAEARAKAEAEARAKAEAETLAWNEILRAGLEEEAKKEKNKSRAAYEPSWQDPENTQPEQRTDPGTAPFIEDPRYGQSRPQDRTFCVKCGREVYDGQDLCPECRAPQNFCVQCGNPVYDGEALCTECRRLYSVNSEFSQMPSDGNKTYYENPSYTDTVYDTPQADDTKYINDSYNDGQYNNGLYDNEYNGSRYTGPVFRDDAGGADTGRADYGENSAYAKKTNRTLVIIIIVVAVLVALLAGILIFAFATGRFSSNSSKSSSGNVYSDYDDYETETLYEETETTAAGFDFDPETETETETEEETTSAADLDDSEAVEYFILNSDSIYFTEDDIEGWTKDMCRYARNGIYARHGRIFEDEALNEYFNSFDWYEGIIEADDFDDSVFNDAEISNLRLIISYESEMGYR